MIEDPLFRRNPTPVTPKRSGKPYRAPPFPRDSGKYPTKATKLELLRLCDFMQAADIPSVANRFGLTYNGAKVKLWRLTKQGILEARLELDGKTKTWWLTPAGEQQLQYLAEAERCGGTKAMMIARLQAEIKRLRQQMDINRGVVAEAVSIANKNVALEQALAQARQEIEGLKAERRALLKTFGQLRKR